MSGNFAIKGGGVGPLMANAILNFHFDYLNPSLTSCLFGAICVIGPFYSVQRDYFICHLNDITMSSLKPYVHDVVIPVMNVSYKS